MTCEHACIFKMMKLGVREKPLHSQCRAQPERDRGLHPPLNPFTVCASREELGKATESQHSREINFKLPQSLLSDSKAPTQISSLSTSSTERNHQSCLCVTRVAPPEPLPVPPSDRTCLGRRICSRLLRHSGPHLCQLSNLWMHFFLRCKGDAQDLWK